MGTLYGIRPGDRVTLLVHGGLRIVNGRAVPELAKAAGKAMICAADRIVVNLGGKYGRPGVVTADNYVSHKAAR